MWIFVRRVLVAGSLLLAMANVASAQGNPLSEENIYRVGKNLGRVAWGMRWCGMQATDLLKGFTKVASDINPRAFKRGFDQGILDGVRTDMENGRRDACYAIRGMYGPEGLVFKGLVK